MKKVIALSIGILLISLSSLIASTSPQESFINDSYRNNNKSYIFTEQNVEFSVYPDGQFDFTYLGNYNGSNTNVTIGSPNVNISFNAGYDYDMYVQYDDYGAVIQIEDVPIYYDEFGRISQAGSVDVRYNNRRIVQVGGLYVHYNYYGYYSHYTGYINNYNNYYVYRPWHSYYVRPIYTSCIVYDYPYRRYYSPARYSYYKHTNYYTNRGRRNIAYTNGRRGFRRPGSQVHYKNGRTKVNRDYKPNRRNTAVASNLRDTSLRSKKDHPTTKLRSKRTINKNNSLSNRSTIKREPKSLRGNNTSKSLRTTKVASRKNVTKRSNSSNYKKPTSRKNTYKSTKNRTNKVNYRSAVVSNSKQNNSNKRKTSNSRGSVSKRGRGL